MRWFWRWWPHEHRFIDWRELSPSELQRRAQFEMMRRTDPKLAQKMIDCLRCGKTHRWHHRHEAALYRDALRDIRGGGE